VKWVDVLPIILGVLTLLGGGGGIWSLFTVGRQRRQLSAQATALEAQSREALATTVKTLSATAVDLVHPLQRTLKIAEARAEVLTAKAETLNAQLQVAQSEVTHLRVEAERGRIEAERAYEILRRLRLAIMDPNATIIGLRALVDNITNGRTDPLR